MKRCTKCKREFPATIEYYSYICLMKKKKLKKHPTGEELIEHHIALDMCPEDFEVDVFHPYYMGKPKSVKKLKL